MTKKELLDKNEKLEKIDYIITHNADRKMNREKIYALVMENFGESATLDDIKDLLEYYDVMTNDVTMVGSKLYDSTLFEPIKELAIAYKEELSELNSKLEKAGNKEQLLKRVVENQHVNYTLERDKSTRYATENEALKEENQKLKELLDYVSLSDKNKAKRVISAEENEKKALAQADDAKRGAEKAIATSKELEKAKAAVEKELEATKKELADAESSNKAAAQKNLELEGQVAEGNKKNKTKNIVIATLSVGLGIAIAGAIVHLNSGKGNPESINPDDPTAVKVEVAKQQDGLIKVGNLTYQIVDASKQAVETAKTRLAAEDMENVTVKDAYDKISTAYDYAVDTSEKINATIASIEADKAALDAAEDTVTVASYIGKNTSYMETIAGYVVDASDIYGDVTFGLDVAYGTASSERSALKEELDNLKDSVAAYLDSFNNTFESGAEDLDQATTIATTFVENAEERYEALKGTLYGAIDYTFNIGGFSCADVTYEDGVIKTFNIVAEDGRFADLRVSEEGRAALESGEDLPFKASYFEDVSEAVRGHEGYVTVLAMASSQQEEETHTQGNENGGESEVAENDDEGKTPSDPTGEQGHTDNPNASGNENQNGDETTPTGTEIVDDGEQPGDDEQPGDWGNGNGRD